MDKRGLHYQVEWGGRRGAYLWEMGLLLNDKPKKGVHRRKKDL